jgi:hypothetical protein
MGSSFASASFYLLNSAWTGRNDYFPLYHPTGKWKPAKEVGENWARGKIIRASNVHHTVETDKWTKDQTTICWTNSRQMPPSRPLPWSIVTLA